MVDVFFRGYGAWWSTEYISCDLAPEQVTASYEAAGVFKLTDHDSMTYRHCKELVDINKLLPSKHPDSELARALRMPDIVDHHAFCGFDSRTDEKYYYFSILTTHTLLIAAPHSEAKPQKIDISKNIDSNDKGKFEIGVNIDVVTRANLIGLVSLSKTIAKHHKMSNAEACDWVTREIVRRQSQVYDTRGLVLPELFETELGTTLACECFNQNWWNSREKEDAPLDGYFQMQISANEIAISKADAEQYFSIPLSAFEEPPSKMPAYTGTNEVINEMPQKKDDSTEAEQRPHISKDLVILNEAASVFWLNADPAERDTHPTNEKVADWLRLKGFSDISAKQGAVIIRPKWAAKGRR